MPCTFSVMGTKMQKCGKNKKKQTAAAICVTDVKLTEYLYVVVHC